MQAYYVDDVHTEKKDRLSLMPCLLECNFFYLALQLQHTHIYMKMENLKKKTKTKKKDNKQKAQRKN